MPKLRGRRDVALVVSSFGFALLLSHCGSSAAPTPAATPADDGGASPSDGGTQGDSATPGDGGGTRPDAASEGGSGYVLPDVRLAASGFGSTCAIMATGSLKCWGANGNGNLGLGDLNSRGDQRGEMGVKLPTVDLGPGRRVTSVSLGGFHACAALDDGTVKCWGSGGRGQLGRGDTASRGGGPGEMGTSLAAIDLGPGRRVVSVAAGGEHSCALFSDGAVKCWGRNDDGQLGLGDTNDRGDGPGEMGAALPTVDLGPGRKAVAVAAQASATCARLDDGSAKCWGSNALGSLGLGDSVSRGTMPGQMGASLPVLDLGSGQSVLEISSAPSGFRGEHHQCAVLVGGAMKCWGRNDNGELGLGDVLLRGAVSADMGASLAFVALGAGRTARHISAGTAHTCALLDNAKVKCWGANGGGQLGGVPSARGPIGDQPDEMGDALPFVDLGTGRTVVELVSGASWSCARLDTGTIKCWGGNTHGELGLGDTRDRGGSPSDMGDALPAVDL